MVTSFIAFLGFITLFAFYNGLYFLFVFLVSGNFLTCFGDAPSTTWAAETINRCKPISLFVTSPWIFIYLAFISTLVFIFHKVTKISMIKSLLMAIISPFWGILLFYCFDKIQPYLIRLAN